MSAEHESDSSTRIGAAESPDIVRADAKAKILVAAIGVISAVVLGAALAADWTPADLATAAELAAWSAVGGVYAALMLAGAVIWPRVKVVNPRRLTFFDHVATMKSVDERRHESERGRDCRSTEQLFLLGRTAKTKYHLLRAALVALAASSVLMIVAVLLATLV